MSPRSSVLLGLLTVQTSKVHFKHTSTAATTVCISYSKSLVMTENATYFSWAKSSKSLHKRTTCGCRRISFLFCFCFQVKFQVQSSVSTVKTPIMSELEVNTMHLWKRTQINTRTGMVKYHVPACITLQNYSSNISAVAEVINHCLLPSNSLNDTELKGCQSKAYTKTSACYGRPMEQRRPLYFRHVISTFCLFFLA